MDKGYITEKKIGIIKSKQKDFFAGYFQFFPNSNIYLDCPDGDYYWGIYNEIGTSLSYWVDKKNGLINLIYNPR